MSMPKISRGLYLLGSALMLVSLLGDWLIVEGLNKTGFEIIKNGTLGINFLLEKELSLGFLIVVPISAVLIFISIFLANDKISWLRLGIGTLAALMMILFFIKVEGYFSEASQVLKNLSSFSELSMDISHTYGLGVWFAVGGIISVIAGSIIEVIEKYVIKGNNSSELT